MEAWTMSSGRNITFTSNSRRLCGIVATSGGLIAGLPKLSSQSLHLFCVHMTSGLSPPQMSQMSVCEDIHHLLHSWHDELRSQCCRCPHKGKTNLHRHIWSHCACDKSQGFSNDNSTTCSMQPSVRVLLYMQDCPSANFEI